MGLFERFDLRISLLNALSKERRLATLLARRLVLVSSAFRLLEPIFAFSLLQFFKLVLIFIK